MNIALIWFPTLIIYLTWLIFDQKYYSNIFALLIIIFFYTFNLFKYLIKLKHKKQSENKPLLKYFRINSITIYSIIVWILFFSMISLNIWVLSPLIYPYQVEGNIFIGLSGIADFFKHSYVITSLLNSGIWMKHPYFPGTDFNYYYGYYLLPSLVTYFFRNSQLLILIIYALITNLFSLGILKKIVEKHIFSSKIRLLIIGILLVGYGFDIIPNFVNGNYFKLIPVEKWDVDFGVGLRIESLYKSFLWVPQHYLSAVLALWLLDHLIFDKNKKFINIFGVIFFCFLSSAFISIYLSISLGIIFIFFPKIKTKLFITGVLVLLLLSPYISHIIGNKQNVFSTYSLNPFPFFDKYTWGSYQINYLLTVFSQYGLLPFLLFVLWFKNILNLNKFKVWLGGIIIFPIFGLILFIKSADWNDFSTRSPLVMLLAIPIILGSIVEKTKNKHLKTLIILSLALSFIISFPGLIIEYGYCWKKRQVLTYHESQLIQHIRKKSSENKIIAIGRDEWIFLIPPLGFKSIYTNDFYDSAMYINNHPNSLQIEFGENSKKIFIDGLKNSTTEIPNFNQKSVENAVRLLGLINSDYLIVDSKIFVKKGINPWTEIFTQANNKPIVIGGRYYVYKTPTLIENLKNNQIQIGPKQTIKINQNKFNLNKGLWFIQICNTDEDIKTFKFEPEEHFTLFSDKISPNICWGNYFYQPDNSLLMSNSSNVIAINVFPLKIMNNQSQNLTSK